MELTTAEAAARLGMTDGRVRQLIRAGALRPSRKVGGAYLLDEAAVDAFAKTQPAQTVGYPRGRPKPATGGTRDQPGVDRPA